MRKRTSQSIRQQLTTVGVFITSLALAVLMLGTLIYETLSKHQLLVEAVQVSADVLGRNSEAAILFNDQRDASELLASLEGDPNILRAAIFLPDNTQLADYKAQGLPDCQPISSATANAAYSMQFSWCSILLYKPIILHGQTIGSLALEHSLEPLRNSLIFDLLFSIAAIIITLLLSQQIWKRVARRITSPLYHLSELTQRVQHEQDFSLRATIGALDEVGKLALNFNRMMGQLQRHDVRLKEELGQRRNAEERLNQLAYYDNVTGLNNRHHFKEQLKRAVNQPNKHKTKCAVLFIDLDGFKKINDTLGHDMGDMLLCQVAQRLKKGVREQDTICRLGGDEFAIIVEHNVTLNQIEQLCERLVKLMAPAYQLQDNRVFVTASIGASLYPEHALNAEALVKNADIAMYEAKENGKNGFCIFSPSTSADIDTRFRVENDLYDALAAHQFQLHYQPLFNANDRELTGFEVLLRWHHPTLGCVSPAEFISIAEDTEMIIPIGEWVLEQAIRQLQEWKHLKPNLKISVNLSGYQLKSDAAIERLISILHASTIEPGNVELELTEGALLDSADQVRIRMQQLLSAGFLLSLDDFGTGYSSLSSLHTFPFTRIKIDRSFVAQLNSTPESQALIRAIIAIGEALQLDISAEGVENEQQARILTALGSGQVQGYYLGNPMPAEATQTLIEQQAAAPSES